MAWRRGQAYSQDLRDRVFKLSDEGMPAQEVAELLHVGTTYVYRVLRWRALEGVSTKRAGSKGRPPIVKPHEAAIAERMRQAPDTTIMELRTWLAETHGVTASVGALWSGLRRLGLTYKKSSCVRPNKTGPMSRRHARDGKPDNTSRRPGATSSSMKRP